ncbi:sulfatase [Spiribacter sp. 2438]|uniref:sulfatase-like hydrolase/transferase n=1 Tax=Spiribacter sp. 2438 TaxID=2666185 RepID=UPI0012AFE768|nr:sulfatase-like hydrolase/transferase [Spiribacter sp. 2438]QGM21733.1 sulfatase [Spiribacter sp. 2438]
MRTIGALGLSALVFFLVLVLPNHPTMFHPGALAAWPLELPALLALLVFTGLPGLSLLMRLGLVFSLVAVVLLRLADVGTFIAYNRHFNLVADLHFAPAVWNLLVGSVGLPLAVLAAVGGVLALLVLMGLLWWGSGVWARLPVGLAGRGVAALVLVPAVALVVADINHRKPASVPGEAFAARVAVDRSHQMAATYRDMQEFREAALRDPMLGRGPFFDALDGRDLVIVYIESYGRSSFENPLYIPTHTQTLKAIQERLDGEGLAMRSGWATAPMVGGQSWLAHGSVATGLWLHNQPRYRAMINSGRRTLYHYGNDAGFRTVAIKPAHVMGWPEGEAFNFDAIYNAPDLGYEGPPFNWVTMPDQFTLKAFERLEQGRDDRPPLMAQIALISSHAPWVPVPELVDWESMGAGEVFEEAAASGDAPEVVWQDEDRIRDQFRQAVDYSLQVVGSWAEHQAGDPPLMIVLGDHEPARFVAGVDGYDVPIHVIGPADLVDRFEDLDWQEGMIPSADTPARRMDNLRDILLRKLSSQFEALRISERSPQD